MKRLVEFPTEDGTMIVVEVEHTPTGQPTTRGLSSAAAIERAHMTLQEAVHKVQPVAEALIAQLKSLDPDEATIEFGLQLNAELGAVLATMGSTVHYRVQLSWRKSHSTSQT